MFHFLVRILILLVIISISFKHLNCTKNVPTAAVDGFSFVARDLGIENTAGSIGHQAVALRSSSDMSIFYNCQIDGYQDTLYVHDHRQFYRDCTISGTIDFIFSNATALFQNCNIIVRKPDLGQSCMVTAQGRSQQHSHTCPPKLCHHCGTRRS